MPSDSHTWNCWRPKVLPDICDRFVVVRVRDYSPAPKHNHQLLELRPPNTSLVRKVCDQIRRYARIHEAIPNQGSASVQQLPFHGFRLGLGGISMCDMSLRWLDGRRVGVNARCLCGSGYKIKHCCVTLLERSQRSTQRDVGVYLSTEDFCPGTRVRLAHVSPASDLR